MRFASEDRLHGLLRRALRSRRTRAVLAASGVAGSTLLVLVLLATYRSLTTSAAAYAGQPGCDLWVAPRGTGNLIRSGGYVPASWEEAVSRVPGVVAVDPILRTFVSVSAASPAPGRSPLTLLAIGYRGPTGLGGPPALASGRSSGGPDEVTLDRAAAFRLRVAPGDELLVDEERMRVVGLTRGTNLLATQFLFGDYDQASDALGAYGRASFLLVRVAPGQDSRIVAARVAQALPHASVLPRHQFVLNNQREVSAGFLPLLLLLTVLGVAVAALLVGLLAQGLVEDRRGDIAVLFALGADPLDVARGVLAHVAGLVLAGSLLGAALAHALAAALDRTLPTIELTYRALDLAGVLALSSVAGVAAALAPVARLRRIDPLEAFRP